MDQTLETSLPPGPTGRWLTTMRILRNPRYWFHRWSERYGDPFTVRSINGHVVLTGRSDLIRDIFAHDPNEFDVFAARAAMPIFGRGSLLMLSGESHRRERKLVMPMFHGDRMRAYANIMQQAAIETIDTQPRGAVFRMIDATTKISLRVITEAIFGGEQPEAINRMMCLGEQAVRKASPILFFSPHTQRRLFGLGPWDRYLQATAELERAFDEEFARRQADGVDRQDVLSMLMAAKYDDGSPIDRQHARDELRTFLFAGHETSAIAMAWAIYYLHSNPTTLARLRGELSSLVNPPAEELARLPYLKAVVQETLRINPIATEVLRVLKSPMVLDGYRLPAGAAVAPATILAHYNEQIFPDPDEFRPERFLDHNYSSAEYFPYGGGSRRCAGAAFASYEMAIVLGSILTRYEFELLEPQPVVPVRRNIAMGPHTGVRVRRK